MDARYFAYGSNLTLRRMRERVPGAAIEGVARLWGYRLTWDKCGGDGSGKANLRIEETAQVWGVVYRFGEDGWPLLDVHEPGYARIEVEVSLSDAPLRAHTYLSETRTGAPPFSWYKLLVVEGARAHALPEAWVRALEQSPAQPDR